MEYEQIADGNTEAYFTLLTLAEGTVLLNGVKALVAKVGGAEALKIIAKETAMSIKDAGAFVNDLVRGRGLVMLDHQLQILIVRRLLLIAIQKLL
ncbi:hypothetical protein BSPWISOXPB_78 [uncultured Gammaproteobacteria bacterium]|nr:hypothetical protein BSPWISOXPB_78 [uncultured Gammaproteobacteria bacterium]